MEVVPLPTWFCFSASGYTVATEMCVVPKAWLLEETMKVLLRGFIGRQVCLEELFADFASQRATIMPHPRDLFHFWVSLGPMSIHGLAGLACSGSKLF